MTADDATIEAPQLQLPADLLAEVTRRAAAQKTDFRVEGWKPTLLERIARLFGLV